MSILINKDMCKGCNKCVNICPGSLIKKDSIGKSYIKYPERCWGCSSCLKECEYSAIKFYLGADIGGAGTKIFVKDNKDLLEWFFEKEDGSIETIKIFKKEANNY